MLHFRTGASAAVGHAVGSDHLNGAGTRHHFIKVEREGGGIGTVVINGEAGGLQIGNGEQRISSCCCCTTVHIKSVEYAREDRIHRIGNPERDVAGCHTIGVIRHRKDDVEESVTADDGFNIAEGVGDNTHIRSGL